MAPDASSPVHPTNSSSALPPPTPAPAQLLPLLLQPGATRHLDLSSVSHYCSKVLSIPIPKGLSLQPWNRHIPPISAGIHV